MRIQGDPDPGQISNSQKIAFFHEKCTKVGSMSKNIPTKAFLKSIIPGLLFVYFLSVSMLPDPDPHSQYGSGSKTSNSMRIRIHNTDFFFFIL
jgi:hypothetical protein